MWKTTHYLNLCRVNGCYINSRNMLNARTNFRRSARSCRYEYDKSLTNVLIDCQKLNGKQHWKMFLE